MRAQRVFNISMIFCSLLILSGCAKGVSEEDRLRGIVDEVASAGEKKDIEGVRRHLSKTYKDQEGNDYDGVKRVLLYHFLRAETVSIFVRGVDVEIKGGTALVRANVVLVRGKEIKSLKDIIPESAVGYRFDVVFKKEDGGWKAINGQWQDVGVGGLL
ncbi:MAG: hypothetical protein HY878_06835 [Deltaproteobacteria bacterium]|nr:hypothetical protein [Deltaproteobacteria bacterium]